MEEFSRRNEGSVLSRSLFADVASHLIEIADQCGRSFNPKYFFQATSQQARTDAQADELRCKAAELLDFFKGVAEHHFRVEDSSDYMLPVGSFSATGPRIKQLVKRSLSEEGIPEERQRELEVLGFFLVLKERQGNEANGRYLYKHLLRKASEDPAAFGHLLDLARRLKVITEDIG